MKSWKKVISIIDYFLNLLIILVFLPVFLYGIYAIWDSGQIYRQADASLYETYRPSAKSSSEEHLFFEELKKINPEIFGWLTVKDTQIDYPLVQASNNSKYVNTDVRGDFSLSGSIFLDCRNKKNFSDINNVIYGHHMQKNAMFGEIAFFDEKDYFETHKYGKLFFENVWHEIEFFAFIYADAYDSVIYNTALQGENGCNQYLNYVRENARHFRELDFQSQEHFAALSTCASGSTNGRYILVGRITNEAKNDKDEM